jgi:preprotein translocase subunit YajC
MYVPIILIFYFLIIRPQRQQQKKIKEMLANLKKNDEVVTTSGIHGTVTIIKEKTVVLRVDEGCRIEFDRESIAAVINTEIKPEVVK